ncbi:MAG: hypothetical protein DYG83_16235 [Candidatus Brocadia sp. AMX2]|uniref:RCC1-like domain-containing protein n=1 Tax=Candidatus Brocadia sinica JPN1 TaxID=1197129 RepID=A0ABQ0K154_9BACT|nr:carboxypeptidase regulatory-like domain-containing protein [Candidatus Brocadia sinica]KAA0242389.1 MAG: hypothetical protein EDM70_14515 [Candidatus Brocadia sp. AMX2]MBL1170564.1 hypothetical protein [Candidatus Brocadia sp. AMX1]NOG42467.1 hypothetical protein [Planctomycetota bacterium]RIJ89139.1 MAG: hypothetical protein DB853_15855 [Candidatus Brocadia sp.]MCE7868333.1 hypothetical protein [Candidatus Brocadia sp. AMX2]
MKNISFVPIQVKFSILSCIAIFFSLVLTASNTSLASVVPQLAGGGHHSLVLKPDGTVWAWGRNDFGQLGNGTTSDSTIPIQVNTVPGKTGNFNGITAIAGGWSYSVALKFDGTVWGWGRNDFGQLGNGTTNDSAVPVQVNNLSDAAALAGGGFHGLALRSDGTVWGWGRNDFGQLGNGTTNDSAAPVQVSNLSDVAALAGGGFHSLALKSDGTVWGWGRNDFGQLGNGTTNDSATPVQVSNLSDVAALAGGRFHSLALKSDGTVWAWGQNDSGQLGNGTAGNSTVPGQVKNLSNVIAIERGRSHSLAAKSDGTVWGWGDNSYGQLGNGATSNSTVPVQVKNLSDVAVIGGGGFHSLGLKSEGTVWAWGRNNSGQLGDGTTKDSAIPVQVFIDLSIETGNIAGVVKDATIGAGINNATVTLDDQSNTTTTSRIRGQDGVYKFRDVSAGNHTLSVQATGFETGTQSITVEKGQPNPKTGRNIFNFALISTAFPTPTPTPGTGNLGGQVTDVGTGGGIVGATVSTDTGLTTTTVKNGAYAFRNIAAGDYTLTASATGYTSASQSATVTTGKNTRADFALTSGGTPTPTPGTGNLGGQVTDVGTGGGIVGATVSTDTGLTTTTVKNGAYAFRNIATGDYTLTASATGYTSASQSATVTTGKNTRADFALISGGTPTPTPTPAQTPTPGTGNLAGQVTDTGTGAGIVGATVSTDTGLTTTTVKNGIYTFRDITAGDYILTVFATGYGLASQSATVVAGKNTRADFALIPEIPTPTPEATPTPTCEADLLVASSKRLRLQTEESAEETITVFCENDIPLAGETITWKIKSGRKRITITPDSAVTNANGEARFTITATDRIGDAKIKFEGESADLKTTVTVKVIE